MSGYTFGEKVDLGYLGEGRQVVAEDGTVLGVVYKGVRTWERRTSGAPYVNARGTTPCWKTDPDWAITFDTRKQAAEYLLRDHEHPQPH